jgi:hypothetical protein
VDFSLVLEQPLETLVCPERIYAYPMTAEDLREWLNAASASGWEWSETAGWVSAAQLRREPPLGHLFAYLLASNFIVPMQVPAALRADA